MAVREIRSRGEQDMDLRGFVDDDPLKQGAVIGGLKVLGSSEALPTLVPALGIDQVIITIADAPQTGTCLLCRASKCARHSLRLRRGHPQERKRRPIRHPAALLPVA